MFEAFMKNRVQCSYESPDNKHTDIFNTALKKCV